MLGHLNAINLGQSNLSCAFESGFKRVNWNSNLDTNLLCAITNCNQLFLLDCTRLTHENNLNLTETSTEEKNETADSYENVFDLKTNSKYFNLTELWLVTYRPSIIKSQPNNLNDFLLSLNQITPTCVTWSSVFKTKLNSEFELLFVAFKSNEIGIFLIYKPKHAEDIQIKLYGYADLGDKLNFEDSNTDDDELLHVNLSKDVANNTITCMHFNRPSGSDLSDLSTGFLGVGSQNSSVLLVPIRLDLVRISSLIEDAHSHLDLEAAKIVCEPFALKLAKNCGKILKLELIGLRLFSEAFLLVVQKENTLLFKIVTQNGPMNSLSEQDASFILHLEKTSALVIMFSNQRIILLIN